MLFSIHCRCIECCVYFSFFHLPVFFCIFKVKHNTCVTADIKQPKYFPGCGKHFPFEFFGTAKIYVENSVSLSLFFLSSRLCGIYQQIFVIFNVLTLSFAHYLVFCSELELFQEYLNFLKIERVSVRISWCIIKKFARWNLVWYWTNNFLWKLFFLCQICRSEEFSTISSSIAFQSRSALFKCGKLNRFYLENLYKLKAFEVDRKAMRNLLASFFCDFTRSQYHFHAMIQFIHRDEWQ